VPGTPLEHARLRYRFCVYGFVVMLEHVHLLVSEPDKGSVANAMQSLKISSALRTARFREFQGRRSPLWQKRSHDRNIRDYAEFVEKLRYLHRYNPLSSEKILLNIYSIVREVDIYDIKAGRKRQQPRNKGNGNPLLPQQSA